MDKGPKCMEKEVFVATVLIISPSVGLQTTVSCWRPSDLQWKGVYLSEVYPASACKQPRPDPGRPQSAPLLKTFSESGVGAGSDTVDLTLSRLLRLREGVQERTVSGRSGQALASGLFQV